MRMARFMARADILAVLMLLLPVSANPAPAGAAAGKTVVVELFTSEGCSSCPPADDLLGRLRRENVPPGTEVIPLGFHVDYWDGQGWKDRFSSPQFTRRQEEYAQKFRIEGPYTPQMVVNGETEFVGNSSSRARNSIAQAAAEPQPAEVAISAAAGGRVLVRVKANGTAEVMLAVTEDNLTTKVGGGENGGRTLYHSAVVREFRNIGETRGGSFEAGVPLKTQKDWKQPDLRVVVFAQDPASGKILGAASLKPF
ncbi:MAG TPA: DUF1223 domain-containing protein [Candidatus Limnocylindrales bacterium]|nr:DUF1223 domain-containing protein [Candidatus Limnocylindrales bacterium]